MRVLSIGIKLADDVPVQCPHDANPREHRRPAQRRDQDQGLHRRLPFRGFVLDLWQLRDEGAGVLQRDELATAGQRDRMIEGPFPTRIWPDDQRRIPSA
jgi:hypothetical protein